MDDHTAQVLRTGKQYSIGKGKVWSYHASQEDAERARADDKMDRRTGIYVWDAREGAEGGNVIISTPPEG
jgi:hypothetical protein